jgi:anti-sigma regulatory factor (Ser/Thr protein kinase)
MASRDLAADIAAPAEARRMARHTLGHWGLGDLVPDVSLLVSELVTNVVRHARTPATLTLCVGGGVLEVAVTDQAEELPLPGAPSELTSVREGGRGLQLVDRIADDWGVSRDGRSKHVWFRLPVGRTWKHGDACPCAEPSDDAHRTGSGRSVRAVPGPWDLGGTVTPLR